MTKEIVLLINKALNYLEVILGLVEKGYAHYKRRKREKAIEKILNDPDAVWGDRFGHRVPTTEDLPDGSQ